MVGAMLASKDKAEDRARSAARILGRSPEFVRQANGELRVLDAETTPSSTRASRVTVSLPFDMDVRWPNRRLPTRVSLTADERVRIRFLPPWRSGHADAARQRTRRRACSTRRNRAAEASATMRSSHRSVFPPKTRDTQRMR